MLFFLHKDGSVGYLLKFLGAEYLWVWTRNNEVVHIHICQNIILCCNLLMIQSYFGIQFGNGSGLEYTAPII